MLGQALEYSPIQALLIGEVVINRSRVGAGPPANLGVGGISEAFIGKDFAGFLENGFFRGRATPSSQHIAPPWI
jgi:hypothetical protein